MFVKILLATVVIIAFPFIGFWSMAMCLFFPLVVMGLEELTSR